MKKGGIGPETSKMILEAAWRMASESRTLDLSMSELARMSGVSRQTVYLAFENRAGLLAAMVQNRDDSTDHVRRISETANSDEGTPEALFAYLQAWIDYIAIVYPVASLMSAGSLTDPDVAKVWATRMGLIKGGFYKHCAILKAKGLLRDDWTPKTAGDLCFSLSHVESWRTLVVENGWAPEAFSETRKDLIRATVLKW